MVRDRQHGPVIELNRIQVKRSRSKGGLAGPDGIKSVFGQLVTKMSLLTQEALFLPHRVWKVKFVGKKIRNRIIRACIANGVKCTWR
jgi:E3 ubiquitin-protein ligase HERC2